MTLKDIAEKTVSFLGITLDFSQTGEEQTFVTTCVKDVLMRLTGEMVDVWKKKSVATSTGSIPFSSVDADYKRALSVSKNGKKVSFGETSAGLQVGESGTYDVTYAYFVRPATLLATIDLLPKYSVHVLALGAAGEYCYRKGLYKESETYDERFLAAVRTLEKVVKNVTLKAVNE